MRFAGLIMLCVLAGAGGANGGERPILAVLEIEDSSGKFKPEDIQSATDFLRAGLVSTQRYYVVDKGRQEEKRQAMMSRLKRESYDPCHDESCRIELGRELAADTVASCSVTSLGSTCAFSCELVPLDKAASTQGGLEKFDCTLDGMVVAIEKVTKAMAADGAPTKSGSVNLWGTTEPAGAAAPVAAPVAAPALPAASLEQQFVMHGGDSDDIDDFLDAGVSVEGWRRYERGRISYGNLAWCWLFPGMCMYYVTFRGGDAFHFLRGVLYTGMYIGGVGVMASSAVQTDSDGLGLGLLMMYAAIFANPIDGWFSIKSINAETLDGMRDKYPAPTTAIPEAPFGLAR